MRDHVSWKVLNKHGLRRRSELGIGPPDARETSLNSLASSATRMAFALGTESMVEGLPTHLSRTLSHRIVRSHSTSKLKGLWLTFWLT
jgi:hypothetical protein